MYVHRCIIVPAPIVAQARAMSAQFPSAGGMYTRALAAPGNPAQPVAYISSGPISAEFAVILPLTAWAQNAETGEWVQGAHYAGQAQAVADRLGVPVATVQAVFDACDVSDQAAEAAMQRRGLVFVPDGANS